MKLSGLQLLASAVVLATAAAAFRLPRTVVPRSYQIRLNLPQETFTSASDNYEGSVEIVLIATQENVNQIQLHAAHDFITIATVQLNNIDVTQITIDNSTNIVTLGGFETLSQIASSTLSITFSSRLSTQDMYGFYKSSYVSNNGVTNYLVTTQFQPVYARRAFPCFDEPSFKATFEIYISHPPGLRALSNMPENISGIIDDVSNLTTTYFPISGIMPSYLVAFIVSDFTCTQGENIETDAVPYRICSTDQTSATRAFAVQSGGPLLRSLNTFTGYPYSTLGFPKMDQVAIPDFAAGAMENWGLITYREQYLLWDSVESTNGDQQNVATIIAHEFAHQWWGNLVTADWWSEIFLNEGFATYFEFFTTHEVFPDWGLDKQFVVRVLQRVLETDSLESSQALQAPAESDAQIMARFGQVSYLKGGSVLRMAEHILGTENFILGLRSYLRTHQYGNAVPDNLWASLDGQLTETNRGLLPVNTSLSTVMRNWIETPGYPLLEVQTAQFAVIVRQEGRFLLNGNDNTSRWYVPITYATNQNPKFENTTAQDWLLPLGFVEIPFLDSQWIILNNYVTGYYRVNYNNLWDPIITALAASNFSGIPEVNRASFVDDAFHLARSNRINYTRAFAIIDFLRIDISHHSWLPAINGFNFLLRRIGQDSLLGGAMSSHLVNLLTSVYESVPWTSLNRTNHAYTLKQVDILTLACRLGLSNCVNHALERFGEFRISGIRPTQNLRSIVYCNALRYGNSRDDWDLLWNAYTTTDLASEKVRILSALGCIQDEATLLYYLNLSLGANSGIRQQDAISVFTSVYSGSSIGVTTAFRFLRENHAIIEDRYQSLNALRNIITGLAERFTTESELNELRTFIETGGLPEDFHNAASAALATAEANLLWLGQFWNELHEYYGLDPSVSSTTVPITNPVVTTPAASTTSAVTTPTTPGTPGDGGHGTAVKASMVLLVLSLLVVGFRSS